MPHPNNENFTVLHSLSKDMKVLILLSFLGIAASQMPIQRPIEMQNLWPQQQQQPWDNSIPIENNWNRRPVQLPQQLPGNNWNQQQQQQQPWDNSIPTWQQRPWNNQVTRVPPQPIETEPWLLRPETRCPEVGDNYHWALIIPHFRDQQAMTLCMGGVGSKSSF